MKWNAYINTFLLLPFLLLATNCCIAQKATIGGYVRDAATGENLVGATIFVKEVGEAVSTNSYGFYSITVPKSRYTIIYAYVGFKEVQKTFNLLRDTSLNIELQANTTLNTVEVTAARKDENVKSTVMGTISLSMDRIKTLPVLFGEIDLLKTLQLLPGVQSAGEGNSGFYVRGGGPDQNLVLLDDAVVYNTGHLLGFFSIFNSDAIKEVTLIKGGAAANYGGRLSSVVDVTMKEGNNKEFHAAGGIGLIASRLTLEGPLKKNKGSFIASGRRTYIDALARPFSSRLKNTGYYFYDFNLKANYILSEKDRVYLSGYIGQDKFKFANPAGTFKANIPWGNKIASVRWNHQFSSSLFCNTTLFYNDYEFASNFSQNTFGIKIASGVKDYNAKTDFDYFTSYNNHIKAGAIYTYHTFIPNQISGKVDSITLNPDNAFIKHAHEGAVYVLDDFSPTEHFKVNVGLRYSLFAQIGPYDRYLANAAGTITDTLHYNSGAIVKTYGGLEPRLNMRYEINDASSVKASIAKTYQYVHLVTNNGSTLPTDVWVPTTYLVQPESAWQYSTGYFRNFFDNKLETSVEVYYKEMKNQIQYKDGYVPDNLQDPELSYVFGKGTAYGSEFFVNKTKGKLTGWIGYTLSWTWQQFPLLNNGDQFAAKYDRRHDLSIVGSYEFNKKWTVSSVFIYASGNAITLPTAYYVIEGNLEEYFSKINSFRLPAYHRLDLSAVYTPVPKKNRKWQGSWAFSIYNVYDRKNPWFLYVDTEGTVGKNITLKVYEVYIFPILPSVTYNFRF